MLIFRKPFVFIGFLCAAWLPAKSTLADVWTFETPSENIQCTVGEGDGAPSDITCTIIDRSGPPALPHPTTCNSDWGHTFSMLERGPVEILCQDTDRSRDGFDMADYGVTGNFGGFTCHSSKQGLKCTNRDGNGFFLSRRQQTIIGEARQQAGDAANPTQQNAFATPPGNANTAPIQSAASADNPTVASGHSFADHPPSDILKSAAKFPDFNGRDSAFRNYRTRIRDGVGQGVNFAGHYSFVIISCGTECRFGYVVDLRTGEVFDFPYGGEEHYQMDLLFSRDSRLVKVRWKGSWDSETCTEKDLLVEGTKWRILAERTVPTDDGLCFYDPDIPLDRYGTSAGPAKTSTATPATGQSEGLKERWLVTEKYLQTLGFDPGPVDGVVEAATVLAVHAFQKAYGLKVLNQLPPEHFAILEALAKAKGGSTSTRTGSETEASAPRAAAAAPAKTGVQPPVAVTSSAGNSTTPVRTEEDGAAYHKLGTCEFEQGAAIANYNFRTQSAHPPELEITDLCFDRKSGTLWASEPEDRLTLVKKDKGNDWFEVIIPNTQPFERWRVTVGNYGRASTHGYKNETVNFSYDRPSASYLNWRTTGTQHDADVSLHGYLLETQPAINDIKSEFTVYIGGLDYWDHRRERGGKHLGRESPHIAFKGMMRFDGKTGTADLKNTVETGKDGTGKLVLTVNANGRLSGSGTISLSNARLAGINQHDWKTTTWEIKKLVGHFAGKDGEEFRAVAIASGQTIDHDGFVNPVLAAVTIQGYSLRIEEQWNNEATTGAQ
ncbi:DUF6636 domain-containing protein [Roseibium sp.]|uniref:DUF6636 domain-containing protein n=1 Tax=Roseibium sp. TaxID=1936156 RepID=UPI003A983112